MIRTLLAVAFWSALLLLLHVYCLYPITLFVLGSIINRSTAERSFDELPSVSLVVAAYNEEEVIEEKIRNSLELDYPDDKLDIVVFSDASSDATDRIVRSYEDSGVRLERIEGRVGKTECQNRVAERVSGDIIVFSDADSMYETDAIRRLVEKFDSDVGCVVGELRYQKYGVEAESAYRTFEKLIKRLEPKVSSIAGGNGAIYAVRRRSYVPLPPDEISDFAEPLAIVQGGERAEYTTEARAWENTGETVESEMSRRVRISTRSWNTLLNYVSLLNPFRHPLFSFQLASHHVIRWLSPVLLAVVSVTNLALVLFTDNLLYALLLVGQVGFYLLAAVGAVSRRLDRWTPQIAYVPFYFLVLNYSLVVALWNVVRNRNIVTWETETRSESD
ncbi:glycosyltransferase family 2 protein [Halogeometricum sp. S1BR25-6]|uniref:Glycosyltransferase family 2 protein n=1 Tax=Halogeometricum salsisoli TaxID=2950536 RepID=A0ABU2GHK4_9EURY|nr:glycosyltransferase family 2 protein [Halogeometricum sp. S1BR25-6]MDS0300277.1 glycosyltransferase family 2 protein [Halogeometricum sp. S1BR25-6]